MGGCVCPHLTVWCWKKVVPVDPHHIHYRRARAHARRNNILNHKIDRSVRVDFSETSCAASQHTTQPFTKKKKKWFITQWHTKGTVPFGIIIAGWCPICLSFHHTLSKPLWDWWFSWPVLFVDNHPAGGNSFLSAYLNVIRLPQQQGKDKTPFLYCTINHTQALQGKEEGSVTMWK